MVAVCPKCGSAKIRPDEIKPDDYAKSRTFFFSSDKGGSMPHYAECMDCHYFGSLFKDVPEDKIMEFKASLKK
jgi:hypothetical protein